MGFLGGVFGSRKEIKMNCRVKQDEITLIWGNVKARYRLTVNCYYCDASTASRCDEERCVYHFENSAIADQAMRRKTGADYVDCCKKIQKLSPEELAELQIKYGNGDMDIFCK